MATKRKKNNALEIFGGLVVGSLVSRIVGTQVGNILPTSIPRQVADAAPIALGIYLSNNKNDMAKFAGYGMVAAAGSRLLGEAIPAIGKTGQYRITTSRMNRPANQAIMNRPANQSIMNRPANQAIMNRTRSYAGAPGQNEPKS